MATEKDSVEEWDLRRELHRERSTVDNMRKEVGQGLRGGRQLSKIARNGIWGVDYAERNTLRAGGHVGERGRGLHGGVRELREGGRGVCRCLR